MEFVSIVFHTIVEVGKSGVEKLMIPTTVILKIFPFLVDLGTQKKGLGGDKMSCNPILTCTGTEKSVGLCCIQCKVLAVSGPNLKWKKSEHPLISLGCLGVGLGSKRSAASWSCLPFPTCRPLTCPKIPSSCLLPIPYTSSVR